MSREPQPGRAASTSSRRTWACSWSCATSLRRVSSSRLVVMLMMMLMGLQATAALVDQGCNSRTLSINREDAPYFDPHSPVNVTTQLGSHAYLACIVRQLQDKSVSWVRAWDSHILSVGRYAFIADSRFQSLYQEDSDTWTLQIKYVKRQDAGSYECQVSSEPKICQLVALNVVVPRVEIVGDGRELFVNQQSTVRLECVVSGGVEWPAFILWYRDENRLTGSRRVQISMVRSAPAIATSTLTVAGVQTSDSGNYTCSPSNLPSASTRLHVIDGEHHAAMQDGASGGLRHGSILQLWALCYSLLMLQAVLYTRGVYSPRRSHSALTC